MATLTVWKFPTASGAAGAERILEAAAEGVAVLELARPDGRRLPDWAPGAHIDVTLRERRDPPVLAVRRPVGRAPLPGRGAARGRRPRRVGLRPRRARGGRPGGVRRAAQQLRDGALGALPVRRRRHRHHAAAADDRAGRAGRRGVDAALRRPPARLDGVPRRARAGTATACTWCPRTRRGCCRWRPGSASRARDTVVYCCGPAPLLAAVEQTVAAAGWAPHRLRTERFTADRGRRAGPRRAVRASSSPAPARPSRCTPQISVLAAARDAGATTLSSCEQGVCGTCETTVLARRARPPRLDPRRPRARRRATACSRASPGPAPTASSWTSEERRR